MGGGNGQEHKERKENINLIMTICLTHEKTNVYVHQLTFK